MRTGNRPAVRRNARNKLAAAAATCALSDLTGSVYQTLQRAGAIPGS